MSPKKSEIGNLKSKIILLIIAHWEEKRAAKATLTLLRISDCGFRNLLKSKKSEIGNLKS